MRWTLLTALIAATALAKPPAVYVTEEAPLPPPPPAPAKAPEPMFAATDIPDVRVELDDGVRVNWTHLVVEVSADAQGYGVGADRRAVEQEARRQVGPRMLAASQAVRVIGDKTFADIAHDAVIGEALRSRVERWAVAEAQYYASGKVTLNGELSLQELLKPWALSVAQPLPTEPPSEDEATGMIIDARATDFAPTYAPHLVGADGRVLYDATLWEDHAIAEAPVVYVADPTHPAVVRAGVRPIEVAAIEARGGDLVLSDADFARLAELIPATAALRRGTVLIVVK